MVRFVHTADWQIGMKAAHVGAVGARVREARLDAARRVVAAATQHQADFIAIAGDTFEDNAIDRVLVQRIADILGDFSGPVYIIPGNHDPLVPGSVWDHAAWESQANLHLLRKAEPLAVNSAVLYPCPLHEKHSSKDPTQWIDARHADDISIGLAHGTVEGVSQEEIDYPIARHAADRAGLDYLAIGHWHSTATFPSADGTVRMAYSGSHEPTKFGERDSGNVLLVEIAARGATPTLAPVGTSGLTWEIIECDIGEAGDLHRTCKQIESLSSAEATLLDVRLRGVLHPTEQADLTRLVELVRARFMYGRVDSSRLLPAPADDGWLTDLHVGVMRELASQLKLLSNPAADVNRPDYATPEVAARALLELYRLAVGNRK